MAGLYTYKAETSPQQEIFVFSYEPLEAILSFLCLIFKNWMLNLMLLTFVCV